VDAAGTTRRFLEGSRVDDLSAKVETAEKAEYLPKRRAGARSDLLRYGEFSPFVEQESGTLSATAGW